ncbi:MAG: peptidoglycan DD-metalloendopeptidase family protein, partial [Aquihabitans sp.]
MSGDPSCPAPSSTPTSQQSVTRRMAIKGGLALGAAPLLTKLACTETPSDQPQAGPTEHPEIKEAFGFDDPKAPGEKYVRPMMFPVLNDPAIGSVNWIDSYWAPRGGGTRKHEGQDLMGPKMLKLLACVSGTIVELRHRPTGNSLYLKGDDGWYYCYLHINNDTPGTDDGVNDRKFAFPDGIVQGMRVEQGDHIAFLGDSGNAEDAGSHCHFEIRMPNANMWKAAAVNPRYSLEAAKPAKINGPTVNPVAPFDSTLDFVVRQANDFLGGVPDWDWLLPAVASIKDGKHPDVFIADQVGHAAVTLVVNPIIRMQLACFGATPNRTRVDTLTTSVRDGASLDEAGNQTVTDARLTASSLTNAEFVVHLDQTMWG